MALKPTLRVPSPAKINLFLHITGQRPDGYHNIQTVFQLLDIGDELTFTANSSGKIQLNASITDLSEKDNLIYRAAKLLQVSTKSTKGCVIDLTKRIPMGAGLGGGSSNAATTLVTLNYLWECGLTAGELAGLGQMLGADVPVFVVGKSAFAEGIGEILTPVKLPKKWFLVITPDCHVSTAEIFSNPQLTRNSSPIKIRALEAAECRNDCQRVVVKNYPAVAEALQWLEPFGKPLMTGTGASVFCSFDSEAEANEVFSQLPEHLNGFVARSIDHSPLNQIVK
ncbi:MAG TPA: 4-(cytidine 5'-diphospho)-2-C-methyl-D-erythritol kinase [Porticoccaceae bacterium]|jgi:4-diphosphocytidyl-2-C-methyl-D-erythritol kinase|nr:4-(cytidine 5'-diphospho)-2-C-methyl-D-erythritol kinase [Porticoccaceae bacterium]